MPRLSQGIWILPTLGRVHGLKAIIEDVLWSDLQARVVVVFSTDDFDYHRALELVPEGWETISMKGIPSTTEKINEAFARFPNEAFYGLLSNDLQIESRRALELLADQCPPFGLSYCADQIFNEKIPGHPCVDGDLVRGLGWWSYPRLKHHYVEMVLFGIAKRHGGVKYLKEMHFFHRHHTMGTAPMDSTYAWGKEQEHADIAASVYWARTDKEPTNKRIKELRLAVTT